MLQGAYNHDLAPNERFLDWGYQFETMNAFRYLAICRELGFTAVRIWLCENGEGLQTDESGQIQGVMPELLKSIRALQAGARISGLQIYWSLLDGNSWQRNQDELTAQIASNGPQTKLFAEKVVRPIVKILNPEITFGLEVINEPESMSTEVVGKGGIEWQTLVASIRTIRDEIHSQRPNLLVTSGTQAVFLPGLLSGVENGKDAPVDAIDLHVYHADGGLPTKSDLPVDIGDLKLLAGECGLSDTNSIDENDYLLHYLYNARDLGYEAVFLWKLEGKEHLGTFTKDSVRNGSTFQMTALGGKIQHFLQTD